MSQSLVCNRAAVVVSRLLGFPYVAGCAALAVNAGLLILQPLARLCVRCRISVMNWKPAILTARAVTSSITPHWRRRRLCGDWQMLLNSTTVERLQTRQPRITSGYENQPATAIYRQKTRCYFLYSKIFVLLQFKSSINEQLANGPKNNN